MTPWKRKDDKHKPRENKLTVLMMDMLDTHKALPSKIQKKTAIQRD